MAGVDKDFDGEVVPMPGMRIGFLQQEPQLDPAKDVRVTSRRAGRKRLRWSRRTTPSASDSPSPWTTTEMNRLLASRATCRRK